LDGRDVLVHPNSLEEAIEQRPEIARYQVWHRPDAITVSAVVREPHVTGWTAELAAEIAMRLRSLGAEPRSIHIEIVSELQRSTTVGGKLKVIRSDVIPRDRSIQT
jgi:hypothetical protein